LKRLAKAQWSDGEWYLVCEEVLGFLHEYLAGEMAPDRRVDFERHLAGCDSCRAYLSNYRETILLARAAERAERLTGEMPPELVRAILAARG
jgi:anti-sigma factor RsiW